MRSFFLLAVLFLQATLSFSQEKFLPPIKKGGIFNYQVSVNGQQFPIQMKIDSVSPDYARFKWSMSDGSEGYVTNTKPSLETAIRGFWGELHSGEDQTMPPDQSILVISRAIWTTVQKDKKFSFDEQQYTVKEQPANVVFKLQDKMVNVVYAENANGTTRVWFLNNPDFPILVKIEGNPLGIDVSLQSIE